MRSPLPAALVVVATLALSLTSAPTARAWTWPVDGPILRPFVFGGDPYAGDQHRGVDVGAAAGGAVRAPVGGVVSFSGTVPGGGIALTIRTLDGYSVTLVHVGASGVMKGALVAEGAHVAAVGPSGDAEFAEPYVHLGVRLTADPNGYLDPLGFLPARPPAPTAPPVAGEGAPDEGEAGTTAGTGDPPVADAPPAAAPGDADADGGAEEEGTPVAGETEDGAAGADDAAPGEADADAGDAAAEEGGTAAGAGQTPAAEAGARTTPADDPPVIDEPLPAPVPEAPAAAPPVAVAPPAASADPAAPAAEPPAPAVPVATVAEGQPASAEPDRPPLELRGAFHVSASPTFARWTRVERSELAHVRPRALRRESASEPGSRADADEPAISAGSSGRRAARADAAELPATGGVPRKDPRSADSRIGRRAVDTGPGRLRPQDRSPGSADADAWLGAALALVALVALGLIGLGLTRARRSRRTSEPGAGARIMVVLDGAEAAADPGRGGVAVRERPTAYRPRRGLRRPVRHLRPVPPPARERGADGERHRRARDARHGRGGQGRRLAA
jgi:hypothetical protein